MQINCSGKYYVYDKLHFSIFGTIIGIAWAMVYRSTCSRNIISAFDSRHVLII